MKLKRKWTMGIIATVSVLILAACGGESAPTSPIAPRADLVSPTVSAPNADRNSYGRSGYFRRVNRHQFHLGNLDGG